MGPRERPNDPVADDAVGVLDALEAVAVNALLLERPDHALDHAVLARGSSHRGAIDGVDGPTNGIAPPTASHCAKVGLDTATHEEPSMEQPITIGLDLAKTVFQVHGIDETGRVVCRRQLRRAHLLVFFARLDPCLVGMEACAGAPHWGREMAALGHEVRLMPPAYVKPYVKRGKTDAVDAEAICEAVTRPSSSWSAPAD